MRDEIIMLDIQLFTRTREGVKEEGWEQKGIFTTKNNDYNSKEYKRPFITFSESLANP